MNLILLANTWDLGTTAYTLPIASKQHFSCLRDVMNYGNKQHRWDSSIAYGTHGTIDTNIAQS
jgi:hypothetical protein